MKKKLIAAVLAVGIVTTAFAGTISNSIPAQYVTNELTASAASYAGVYTIPVTLINADTPTEKSMGNPALEQTATLIVNEDKTAVVELSFKSLTYSGKNGYLGFLKKVNSDGSLTEATVLETYDELDDYNNPDSDSVDPNVEGIKYPKRVSIPVEVEFDADDNVIGVKGSKDTSLNGVLIENANDIRVQVYVPVMEEILAGGGTKDAYLRFNGAMFTGSSVSLAGDIKLNTYYNFTDSFLKDENARIVVSAEDGRSLETPVSELLNHKTEYGYMLPIAVPAKDMATSFTAEVISGNGVVEDSFSISLKTYAESLFKDETGAYTDEQKTMAKSLLRYGGYAQYYFDPNTATTSLAFAKIPASERLVTKFDCSGLSEYNYTSNKVAVDGLTYSGTALTPTSETALKHYFKLASGQKIEDYTFTVAGKETSPVQDGDYYYIPVSNISAKNLASKYKVTAAKGTKTYELNYSVLDYCNLAQSSENTALQNITKALYLYWQAAEALS